MAKRVLAYQRTVAIFLIPAFWFTLIAAVDAGPSHWFEFSWLFPVALIISLVANTAGISGAALFVPFFVLVFPLLGGPLSGIQSVQLGLITESFGLTSSTLAFLAFGLIDARVALAALVGALPFVAAGAILTAFIPETVLLLMVSSLLLLAVALLKYEHILAGRRRQQHEQQFVDLSGDNSTCVKRISRDGRMYQYHRRPIGYVKRFFGYGAGGFFQGAAGFGIGEMGIISMILTHIPIRVAIGTSHLVIAGSAIAATAIHLTVAQHASAVVWNILFVTVPAAIIGGQLAPYVAARLSARWLERAVSYLFVVIALSLALLAFNA